MDRVRIKICGITQPKDALLAVSAGVDALGFVFYQKSPRWLSIGKASRILNILPPFVTTVGLFVNASKTHVKGILDQLPLDILQFHGDESDHQCQQYGIPYIKAIRVRQAVDLQVLKNQYPKAKALLLDAYSTNQYGGTGRCFDWSMLTYNNDVKLILAGGLTPLNVRQAICQIRPYAVDVSSGVEHSPGIKSIEKINAFVQQTQHT